MFCLYLDVMLLFFMSNLHMYIHTQYHSVDIPAPNNVQATAISHSSIEVTWDQSPDATKYTISYSTTASILVVEVRQ